MKRLSDQTLYEILEVPRDAAPPAIQQAVERALALYGPGSLAMYSLITPDEATLLTTRIEEARRTLLDPDARTRYDASLAPTPPEARAASSGTNGVHAGGAIPPVFGPIPPVIPAVQPVAELRPQPEPVTTAPPADVRREPEPERQPPPPPPAAPIRLEREIRPAATPPPAPPAAPAPVAQPEIPMPDGSAWTGDALRRVREARGLTIPQIAERTKVTRHHVENIEAERFSALPAAVYLRGILLSLARELRLDGQKVARAYLDRAAGSGQGGGDDR